MFWWEEMHTARVDAALATLVRNNTSIHTLKLNSFQRLSDDSLLTVAQCLPDLHTFQLIHCQGSLSGLAAIRANCTKLRSFEVFRYHLFVLFDDAIAFRYLQLSLLKTLSIFATTLSDAQLVAVAQANPTLQTLRISSIIVAEGSVLSHNALCAALSYLPSLETIDVRVSSPSAYISPCALKLEDAVLNALVRYCLKVSAIDISGHANLSNAAIGGLSSLSLLRSFIADRCVNLLDNSFCTIVQHCRHLEVVSLAHCPHISNVAVYALAQYCRHLTSVYLEGCGGLQNSAIRCLIRRAWRLQNLDLTLNPLLTFDAVAELPHYCVSMSRLRLYSETKKPDVLEFHSAYRSNRRYFDIIFGWSEELLK
eukprot:gene21930-24865_t